MNKHMKRFSLLVGIGTLALGVACGGGNGGGKGSGGGTGSFTNASLSGQYAYQLKGYSGGPFREAGAFTADGNGHITSGKDDFAIGTSIFSDNTTGSYQVNGDGTVALSLSFSGGSSSAFALTLSSSSQFYMIETDTGSAASGTGQKQDVTAFSSVPSGAFVLRMHTINSSQALASTVGAFTVSSGSITGNMDRKTPASFGSSTITGAFNFPDATNGRGSGTFTDSVAGPSTFIYYVVDASHLIFFSTDSGVLGTGQAEKQTGGPFTMASFTGPYAFGSIGDTSSPEGTNTVGRFDADGSGGISGGVYDKVIDGTVSNVTFTGTYTMASSGRAAVTLTPSSGSIQQVYWMVSTTRAFSITNSSTSIEDGSVDTQVGSFAGSTLNGIYAFGITGFDGVNTNDLTGTLQGNGTGTLTMALIPDVNGSLPPSSTTLPINFSGTYTVTSNGRAVGTLSGFSNNLVFYLVSPSNAYILQADPGVELHGAMTKQP